MYNIIWVIIMAQTKLNNPNKKYVHCPYPNCEELVEIINPEEEFIICENNHQFCYKCHQLGIHKKGKCQRRLQNCNLNSADWTKAKPGNDHFRGGKLPGDAKFP